MAIASCEMSLNLVFSSTSTARLPKSPAARSQFHHPSSLKFSVSASAQPSFNSKSVAVTAVEPQPVFTSVKSFAPATVANLGPGFDFLGCAVDGIGDYVNLRVDPDVRPGEVSISEISGAGSKLSKNPLWNCAGIAAIAVMEMLKVRSVGVSLSLEKGLPLGSGLGSSAASAAAAAVAVNELFGGPLSPSELVIAGLKSEAKVSGRHADNIAPSIMGGFVLIRSYDPLELMQLKLPQESKLLFVLVNPEFEAPTKKMRAVLPQEITMSHHVWNSSQAGALVASVLQGDLKGLGRALSSDKIVEPRRAPLIPGMEAVKKAAIAAGAFGCTISGAGPTAVAVTDDEERSREIGERMVEAFMKEGNLKALAMVKQLDQVGARLGFSFGANQTIATWISGCVGEDIQSEGSRDQSWSTPTLMKTKTRTKNLAMKNGVEVETRSSGSHGGDGYVHIGWVACLLLLVLLIVVCVKEVYAALV